MDLLNIMQSNDIFQLFYKNHTITIDKSNKNSLNITAKNKLLNRIYSTIIDKETKCDEYNIIQKSFQNLEDNFYDIYVYNKQIDLIFLYLIGDTQVKIYINLNEMSYNDLMYENERLVNKLIKNIDETNNKIGYIHKIIDDMKDIIKKVNF